MKVSVVGASGYTGGELLNFLYDHPFFQLHHIAAGSNAGEKIVELHPHLSKFGRQVFESVDHAKLNESDLVFIALPHGESSKLVPTC